MSDDIDSLASVAVVQSVHTNWEVEYFYDFDNIYASNEVYFKEKKAPTHSGCLFSFVIILIIILIIIVNISVKCTVTA